MIDIGGGSTEVAIGKADLFSDKLIEDSYSYDMGSVRFTERYLHSDPPSKEEIQACQQAVQDTFGQRKFDMGQHQIEAIGVSGTVKTVARMITKMEEDRINNYKITLDNVQDCLRTLGSMRQKDILSSWPKIMEGKSDVIVGGLIVLEGFLKAFNLNCITCSLGGIRQGALIMF